MTSRSTSMLLRRRRPSPRRGRRRPRPAGRRRASAATSSSPSRTDVDGDDARCVRAASRSRRTTTSRPASIITTWSHTCCTSSSRCVAISTEMPNDAEAGDEREHLFAAERIEAGGRLVEQHELRDRRRAPARAWCAGACRSRTRRSAGSGPRRARRGRGCRTPAGARRAPAARSARRTSTRRRPRSGRAAGSRARACSRAGPARRSGRGRRRCRTPRCGLPSGGRGRAGGGTSSSCPAPLAPTSPMRPRGSSTVRSSSAVTPG